MKFFTITLCAAVLLACNNEAEKTEEPKVASVTTSASATNTATIPDSATLAKNWETYMTPGEAHKIMASWDGIWTAEITMWMAPDAPPSKSTGTVVNKMVLGGRYQQSTFKSNFNGMPFEGLGTLAYDNEKKMYTATWIDNIGTVLMVGK